jgi:ABC-type cobalamin/Fe3+-siderophores transport system ATPase subunit
MSEKVKMPDGTTVGGDGPLVIIGPNGVGKTRLGVTLARDNNGERVAALRNVEIPEIPMRRFADATREVQSALQEVMNQHWRQSYELQNLLSEILAEDREAAVKYREEFERDRSSKPDAALTETRLRKIVRIWNEHFPGREIRIDYEPKVERTVGGSVIGYSIAQMSEGERTALYLAARVVSCGKPVMIVDEPETFFHPVLARRLWDGLEELKPNVRFVYVTHDIPFALSRRNARFAIARSETAAELLTTSTIPADVITEVLGAASFSVSASRLIFCEGKPDSIDVSILTAWHNCPSTVVVPVGGCDAVRECVSVFRAGKVTSGVEVFGYVDRDGWPDTDLTSDPFIKAHPVNEIEAYLCVEPVFKALGRYHGIEDPDLSERYARFVAEAKHNFSGIVLHKEMLNRAKKRVESEQKALLNPIKPDADLASLRNTFESAMPSGGWTNYLGTVFAEEETRLIDSLAGGAENFFRDFPAKTYYGSAAKFLSVTPEALIRTLRLALKLPDATADENRLLKTLRDSIVTALSPHLWPRSV